MIVSLRTPVSCLRTQIAEAPPPEDPTLCLKIQYITIKLPVRSFKLKFDASKFIGALKLFTDFYPFKLKKKQSRINYDSGNDLAVYITSTLHIYKRKISFFLSQLISA